MMQVTLEQVHDIINSNDDNQNVRIASFFEVKHTSYSYTASQTSYHITLSNSDRSYLLLVTPLIVNDPGPGTTTHLKPITLPVLSIVLSKILDNTAVPVPRPIVHDISGSDGKWPFGWLLLRIPCSSPRPPTAVSLASIRHMLSPVQLAHIELRLGTYLRALHGITNDWFGVPTEKGPEPPSVPSFAALMAAGQTGEEEGEEEDTTPYSWQDTFVLQLEELLERACGDTATRQRARCDVDVDQLRRSLSRAIGSFLFDDVEVPGLIWVTGDEEDVMVSLAGDGEADIAYIHPTFGRALWGDPLMEAWFLPPGPSAAISEGYFDGEEDGTLIVFPRHKTKRTWYTIYLALVILAEEMAQGAEGVTTQRETVLWARKVLPECVEILKDAPCY